MEESAKFLTKQKNKHVRETNISLRRYHTPIMTLKQPMNNFVISFSPGQVSNIQEAANVNSSG